MNNDELNEQLSALVDDELRRDEAAFLLKRLGHDPDAAGRFERYCLISDAMRRSLPPRIDFDLSTRISAALADEPPFESRARTPSRRLLRPAAGLAVAASVAALSVLLWPQPDLGAGTPTPAVASAVPVGTAPALRPVAHAGEQWDRLDPEVQRRLSGYLVNHSEHSSRAPINGVLTRVRVAGQQDSR